MVAKKSDDAFFWVKVQPVARPDLAPMAPVFLWQPWMTDHGKLLEDPHYFDMWVYWPLTATDVHHSQWRDVFRQILYLTQQIATGFLVYFRCAKQGCSAKSARLGRYRF